MTAKYFYRSLLGALAIIFTVNLGQSLYLGGYKLAAYMQMFFCFLIVWQVVFRYMQSDYFENLGKGGKKYEKVE